MTKARLFQLFEKEGNPEQTKFVEWNNKLTEFISYLPITLCVCVFDENKYIHLNVFINHIKITL